MKITNRTGLYCLCLLAVLMSSGVATAQTRGVVYIADQDTDGVFELYRADPKTGAVTKLNELLTTGGDVSDFEIGPKGKSVVYTADQDTDEVFELYRADLKTGAVTKLNEPLVAGGDVDEFEVIGN